MNLNLNLLSHFFVIVTNSSSFGPTVNNDYISSYLS